MALQMAYRAVTGRIDSVYEACSTQSFLHGRTERARRSRVAPRLRTMHLGALPRERLVGVIARVVYACRLDQPVYAA